MNFKTKIVNQLIFSFLLSLAFSSWVSAQTFKEGETVFVAFPAGNIKDDAFIVGKVNQVLPDGDFRVAVLDYVEGHDYGVSCIPMVKGSYGTGESEQVWEMWTDTTKLDTQNLDYKVPKEKVLKLGYGKSYFVERNNLYIIFGRWLSDAPMLNIEKMQQSIAMAKANDLAGMEPAFQLAMLERQAFYGDYGRPLYAFETIKPLLTVMQRVEEIFQQDPKLYQLWSQRPRNWDILNSNTRAYFLVNAIDKVIESAWNQAYEDGLERADAQDIKDLKAYIKRFKR